MSALHSFPARQPARAAKAFALGALLSLMGASSWALGPSDPLDKAYQCAVAGQAAACGEAPATPVVRFEERLEPGTQAAYAMYTGVAKEEAIAQARVNGEVPTRQVVKITTRALTPAEKWSRFNGLASPAWEKVELISSTPDRGDAALAHEEKAPAI